MGAVDDAAVDADPALLGQLPGPARGSSRSARTRGTCRACRLSATLAAPPAPRRRASRLGRRGSSRRRAAAAPDPGRRRRRPGRKPRSRISFATACGLQAERGRPAPRRPPAARLPARASWAWRASRSTMSTRSICGPSGAEAEPGEQGAARRRRRGQDDAGFGGGSAGIGSPAAAARRAVRQRIASGFSTSGMNRSSAPIRIAEPGDRPPLLAVERGERLGHRLAGDDAAFVDQHRQDRADRRRRRRVLRGQRRPRAAAPSAALDLVRGPSRRAARSTASRPRSDSRSSRRSSRTRGDEQILARAEPRHLMAAPQHRDRLARLGAQA